MSKLKNNVKSVLGRKVRMGFVSVPLWLFGAVFVARAIRDRRRAA